MWVHAHWGARGLKAKKAHAKPWSAAGEQGALLRGFQLPLAQKSFGKSDEEQTHLESAFFFFFGDSETEELMKGLLRMYGIQVMKSQLCSKEDLPSAAHRHNKS